MTTIASVVAGIKQLETGGLTSPYTYVSPTGAMGAYGFEPGTLAQVMPGVTQSQFLANPALQDQAAATLASQYANQFNGDVASIGQAWLGGPGSVGKVVTDSVTGITTSQYGNNLVGLSGASVDGIGGATVAPSSGLDISNPDQQFTGEDAGIAPNTEVDAPGGDSLTANGAGDVYSGDYTTTYSDPNTAFQTATSAPAVSGVPGGANAPASGATSSGATNSGSGTPIDVTDVTSAGSLAGNAVQSGLNSAASAVTSSTTSAENTGTGWLQSIFNASQNLFVRGGFVLLGIVVLLGAFMFFYKEQGGKFSDLVPKVAV